MKPSKFARSADQVAELVQGLSAFTDQRALVLDPINLNVVVSGLEPLLDRVVGPDIVTAIEVAAHPIEARVDRQQLDKFWLILPSARASGWQKAASWLFASRRGARCSQSGCTGYLPMHRGYR